MVTLDWSQCSAVESIPGKLGVTREQVRAVLTFAANESAPRAVNA
jgi:hypothetical protein